MAREVSNHRRTASRRADRPDVTPMGATIDFEALLVAGLLVLAVGCMLAWLVLRFRWLGQAPLGDTLPLLHAGAFLCVMAHVLASRVRLQAIEDRLTALESLAGGGANTTDAS